MAESQAVIRLVAAFAAAAVVGIVVPVALAAAELLILKPPSYDISLTYVIPFGLILSAVITLVVFVPLGLRSSAHNWWDGVTFTFAAAVAWACPWVLTNAWSYVRIRQL
jgi:hypothetical protein